VSEETIVPFANAQAKRANDEVIERMRGIPANVDGGNPNIEAIENLLRALDGMQTQLQSLTEIVCEQDRRIEKLEKAARGKIIQVRN
jgi:hypothetical protein